MKTPSSKYVFLALVTLALGIAAAPAQASIVYQAVNQTFNAASLVITDINNVPPVPPVYELNPFGGTTPEFRVDAVNTSGQNLLGFNGLNIYGAATGLTNNVDGQGNYAVGTYTSQHVIFGDTIAGVLSNQLGQTIPAELDVDIPIISRLSSGTSINGTSLLNRDTFLKQLLGIDLGGFAARGQVQTGLLGLFGFPNQTFGPYGQFLDGQVGYAGFQFQEGTNDFYNGWIQLKVNFSSNLVNTVTIYDWAYENVAGAPILAGQTTGGAVPLPPSVLLLGSGLMGLGLFGWRRKA
jgi:hypothetical protein